MMNSGYKTLLNVKASTPVMTAGQRSPVDLTNGVQTHGIWVTATATLNVTVNTSGIINGGDILACLTFFLNQNGEDIWQQDGLIAGFITQCFAPSTFQLPGAGAFSKLVPANGNVQGPVTLRSRCYLYAVSPWSVVPRETAFLENDPRQRFQLQPLLNAAPVNQILDMTVGTAALTNFIVAVDHEYVANETALPFLRPRIREQVEFVPGANPILPSLIKTNNRVRGIIIKQESDVAGIVPDIINSVAMRGDNGDLYGPQNVPWADLIAKMEIELGGAVNSAAGAIVPGGMLMINFQRFGRLASVLYPYRDYTNFRLEFNVQPSVTSHAVNSRIRIQMLELEKPMPIAGRDVVAPVTPSFLTT